MGEETKTLNHSRMGRMLYRALPDHYRNQDDGTLAQWVDICGGLLDRLNDTLDTLHEDFLPGEPVEGRDPQPWTLPYTAQLYGATLRSPDDQGRTQEVRHSIRWNRRKGTLTAIEEIVEELMGQECILAEGREKTIASVRIGPKPDRTATPVAGRLLKPKPLDEVTLRAEQSRIAGEKVLWETDGLDGAPAVANSFFDQSLRSVDFRPGSLSGGQAHPSRVVLHISPLAGFFSSSVTFSTWRDEWLESGHDGEKVLVEIDDREELERPVVKVRSRDGNPQGIGGVILIEEMDLEASDIVFRNHVEVRGGNARLDRCAVPELIATRHGDPIPHCDLRDTLARRVQALQGVVRLEHATVFGSIHSEILLASDSIVAVTKLEKDIGSADSVDGLLRYCVVRPGFFSQSQAALLQVEGQTVREEEIHFVETAWRKWGCGVIVRGTSRFVEFGAENLGVLGCYNHRYFSRRFEAMKRKVAEYLPLGMEAAVIEDPLLLDETLFDENRF